MTAPLRFAGNGLLSWLGVKTGGRLPAWPESPLLAPTLELGQIILSDPNVVEYPNEVKSVPGASTANVISGALTVPAGQVWACLALTLASGSIATGAQQLVLAVQLNPVLPSSLALATSPVLTPSPGQNSAFMTYLPSTGVLWLPPGAQVFVAPGLNTVVAATSLNLSMRMVRCTL